MDQDWGGEARAGEKQPGAWSGKGGLLFPFPTVSRVISKTTTVIDYNRDSDIPETFQQEKLCLVFFFFLPLPLGSGGSVGRRVLPL